jgi:putative membrane protein
LGDDARPRGTEPDPRFSLANERTYLAWLRTSLGLIASGIAVERLLPELGVPGARQAIGLSLVTVGALAAATAGRRWRKIEAALRSGEPLPPPKLAQALAAVIAIAGILTIVLLVWGR